MFFNSKSAQPVPKDNEVLTRVCVAPATAADLVGQINVV